MYIIFRIDTNFLVVHFYTFEKFKRKLFKIWIFVHYENESGFFNGFIGFIITSFLQDGHK